MLLSVEGCRFWFLPVVVESREEDKVIGVLGECFSDGLES
jgi:hypothetical protein